jgi:hypothetical protein
VWTMDGPTKGKCLWEIHSVWAWDETKNTAVALREHYFRKHPMTGAEVSLVRFASLRRLMIMPLRWTGMATFTSRSSRGGPRPYALSALKISSSSPSPSRTRFLNS